MLPYATESGEQQAVFEWAAWNMNAYPDLQWMYHVPNEGKRSAATGGRMRVEGLKSGVPDICLPVPHGKYCGLYIEMKRPRGSATSAEQKEWLQGLAEVGHFTALCKGASEAIAVLQQYLRLERVGNDKEAI